MPFVRTWFLETPLFGGYHGYAFDFNEGAGLCRFVDYWSSVDDGSTECWSERVNFAYSIISCNPFLVRVYTGVHTLGDLTKL